MASAVVLLHWTLFTIGHHPEIRPLLGDEPKYWGGALTLASGETWSYESLWPPLQPVVLSAFVRTFGASRLAVEILQTCMLVAAAALLGDLTRRLTGSGLAAVVAGSLVVAYPPLVAFAHMLWPEVLHLVLSVTALWILVARPNRPVWVSTAGVLVGLAATSKYVLWPFLLLVAPAMVVAQRPRPSPGRMGLFVAGFAVAVAAVLSCDRLHAIGTPVLDCARFNAWVGLQDTSTKDFVDPVVSPLYIRYEHTDAKERGRLIRSEIVSILRRKGVMATVSDQLERQFFRLFDKDSLMTDQLPGGVLHSRVSGYAGVPPTLASFLRAWSYGVYALILVGTVVGVAEIGRAHV